jgi:peptidyl-tRNA hydrolase, PTH1 family
MPIRLIVGLGNPGARYDRTRHNVGYRVIDRLRKGEPLPSVRLLKPETVFMNESGGPVAELARKNGIGPAEILVICDDFSLPLGRLRIRLKGSSGGHNGLNSILTTLGTPAIPRLRVGIGPVPAGEDPADFVLKSFARGEEKAVNAVIEKAAEAARMAVTGGSETAMNTFNQKEGEAP